MGISDEVTIRPATRSEAPALTQIAVAAKRHWGYPERWIAAWREALTITPDFISKNEVFVAEVDGEIAGFSALASSDGKLWLEHLWVQPGYMGKGIGRMLFERAAETAVAMNAKSLEIESDPYAEDFYRRMGARRAGEAISELEGQPRVLPLLTLDLGNR